MPLSLRRFSTAALILAFSGACSEQASITEPSSHLRVLDAPANSLQGLVHSNGLLWQANPGGDLSDRDVIGPEGGKLTIPRMGVTLVIPAGAVSKPVEIKMSIHGGRTVAYDFSPHGLVFNKPISLTQDLDYTNATLLTAPFLSLGYYSDPALLDATGGLLSELTSGLLNTRLWTFTANIKHFSGYMMASGRGGSLSSAAEQ